MTAVLPSTTTTTLTTSTRKAKKVSRFARLLLWQQNIRGKMQKGQFRVFVFMQGQIVQANCSMVKCNKSKWARQKKKAVCWTTNKWIKVKFNCISWTWPKYPPYQRQSPTLTRIQVYPRASKLLLLVAHQGKDTTQTLKIVGQYSVKKSKLEPDTIW